MVLIIELIALYKEVQAYYDAGLEIPEDITLLFADDNFGSVRRLPTESEKKRRGGSGVCSYHHGYSMAMLIADLLPPRVRRRPAQLQMAEQQFLRQGLAPAAAFV